MNRHYMKVAAPTRLAAEVLRYFVQRGYVARRTDQAAEFIESLLPMAVGSVDRLEEVPDRLHFLFRFEVAEAVTKPDVVEVLGETGATEVIAALADELRDAGRLDKEAFRAAAGRVRQRTGQKGRALFHPIRVALTGEAGGPELDLAVPAIDRGAELPQSAGVVRILGCRERAEAFRDAIEKT
jgi:glutamyl/glutaminyl-tRNA synthetase